MSKSRPLGGIIHTYQKYDPEELSQPDAAAARPGLAGVRAHADVRQHARADRRGAGPGRSISIPARSPGWARASKRCGQCCCERKRKILEKYETDSVAEDGRATPIANGRRRSSRPSSCASRFDRAFSDEQLRELERLWYQAGDERSQFARQLVQLVDAAGRQVPGRRAGRRSTSSPAARR